MKKFSKVLMLIACLAMVFSLSAGVSAASLYDGVSPIYTVADESTYATTGNVTVTLDLQTEKVGGKAINETTQITLVGDGETSKAYTVLDVMEAWRDANGATFTTSVWDATLEESVEQAYVDGTSTYIFSITKTIDNVSTKFGPASTSAYDGLKFRVNSLIPQLSSGWGATMADTYVKTGDVVTVYYDNPLSENDAVKFTRISDFSINADGKIVVKVQQSFDWFETVYPWTTYMPDFANFTGAEFTIKMGNGEKANVTATYNADTQEYTLNNDELEPFVNYTISVKEKYQNETAADSFLSNTAASYSFTVE